jgi:hypothetical protein
MINPEILAMLEQKYKEMPQDAESVPLVGIPLLDAFHLFKNKEPDNVIFKFVDEENNLTIYVGSNKKKSEE